MLKTLLAYENIVTTAKQRWVEKVINMLVDNDNWTTIFSDGVDLHISFKQPEPKPNLFATWICLGHRIGFLKHPYSVDWKCSNCGYESYWVTPSVCPNCGAKMDEVKEDA